MYAWVDEMYWKSTSCCTELCCKHLCTRIAIYRWESFERFLTVIDSACHWMLHLFVIFLVVQTVTAAGNPVIFNLFKSKWLIFCAISNFNDFFSFFEHLRFSQNSSKFCSLLNSTDDSMPNYTDSHDFPHYLGITFQMDNIQYMHSFKCWSIFCVHHGKISIIWA